MSTGVARLSFLVPCYRNAAHLHACLDSLTSGGRARIEVVAVNDASSDSTGALLDAIAVRDRRVQVVHLSVNGGLGNARNVGLDHASGQYVWFIDADDWLPEGAVDAVIARLEETEPDVLIVDHVEVFGDVWLPRTVASGVGPARGPVPLTDWPALLRLAQSACTKVVRRELLDRAGLRFPDGWYEDAYFGRAVLLAAGSIDVLNRIAYCYRQQTPGSITNTQSARHFEVFDQYARLWGFAGDTDRAVRGELFRAMIDHYLVIVGHDGRLPADRRRKFFHRMAADYRRWQPTGGYLEPEGIQRLKHRLVRGDRYLAFMALRTGYRILRWRRQRSRAQRSP